jgi:hypothetical protein
MSLQPQEIPPVPEGTRRVAQAAFPRGNGYMRLRDELGTVYDDQLFAPLFPARGQPAASPWRLALATVMQFAEQSASELPLPQCGIKPAHPGCTRSKSHQGGQRQDASLQHLRTKASTSAELHLSRESASLRTSVNNVAHV